jgi:hypothetical protein
VSEHRLKAIEKAESLSIAERKERLLSKALRIASKAADRVEDQIDGANVTQATVAFGVATEKIMLLLGETGGGVPVHLNLQVNAQALHEKYQRLVEAAEKLIEERAKRPCNSGDTFSDPPAALDLQSGKENLQK